MLFVLAWNGKWAIFYFIFNMEHESGKNISCLKGKYGLPLSVNAVRAFFRNPTE